MASSGKIKLNSLHLVLVWWLFCHGMDAHARQFTFEHYGQEQGLGNSLMRAITQDQSGFLWAGTRAGLYRYDGQRFQRFDPPGKLPSQHVRSLLASRSGTLWIMTIAGISYYSGGQFHLAAEAPFRSRTGLAEGREGQIYAASMKGLYVLTEGNPAAQVPMPGNLSAAPVYGVFADSDNSIWFGCDRAICRLAGGLVTVFGPAAGVPERPWGGFLRMDAKTLLARGDSATLRYDAERNRFEASEPFAKNGPDQLTKSRDGTVYAPARNGLNFAHPGGEWKRLTTSEGLLDDDVACVFEDREGSFWIGFSDLGLVRWRGRDEWEYWNRQSGLPNNRISSVARDTAGNLWVGSKTGLAWAKTPLTEWRILTKRDGLAGDDVRTMAVTADGYVWAGSATDGLTRLNPANGSVRRIGIADGVHAQKMLRLAVDPHGTLWAMFRDGLYRAQGSGDSRVFERTYQDRLLPGEEIYSAAFAKNDVIWLGGNRGLIRIEGGQWQRYRRADGLREDHLVFLALGRDESVWIGYGNMLGVARVDVHASPWKLQHYDATNALSSDDICFLEVDRRGWVWAGTDNGVNLFDGKTWRHLSTHDGLVWHDTVLNSFLEDRDGSVWIGTSQGLSHFKPPTDPFQVAPPQVAITSLQFGNKPYPLALASVPYHDRSMKVQFSGLSFSRSHSTRFRYRLRGLADGWVETQEREAIFPNLAPGSYTFEVQATTGGGWTQDPARYIFRIEAPWWQSSWFGAGLFLMCTVVLGQIYWQRMDRARRQHDTLERAVAERTRELELQRDRTEQQRQTVERQKVEIEKLLAQTREANRLKGEFLANVSHEIRTPMNGILGMTDLALSTSLAGDQREYIETVRASAESLLSLLNDILDFSKIEANRLELESVSFSLGSLIEESARTFSGQARQKGLALQIRISPGIPERLVGDPNRLRQVLLNLLSNAIKFTNDGFVRLEVAMDEHLPDEVRLQFKVTDTGQGIPADKQTIVFEAFRQADGSTTRKFGGTGLGLTICSRLISLMNGRIWVKSAIGQGSEFAFVVPLKIATQSADTGLDSRRQIERLANALESPARRLRILLAEDNAVNQRLMLRLLEKQGHEVDVASDGSQALLLANSKRFDLVLMDVQMPEMDGLQVTRAIRDSETTNGGRLPILMLTANAMAGDREKCLSAGADGYLPKPITATQLSRSIDDLMAQGKA